MKPALNLLDQLAEAQIEEAIERGVFDHLPGAGGPLHMEDDSMVPENLRAAYRILRNSGYLPREVTIRSEIRNVESLIGRMTEGHERAAAVKRLSLLRARLGNHRCGNLGVQNEYYQAMAEKLAHE
jgi:hypothetical protein